MRRMLEFVLRSQASPENRAVLLESIRLLKLLEEEIEKMRPQANHPAPGISEFWADFHEAVDELVYGRQPGG